MDRQSMRVRGWVNHSAQVGFILFLTGCPSAPSAPSGGSESGTQPTGDEFFDGGQPVTENLAVGGQIDLTGGGSVILPKSSSSGAEISVAEGTLKPEASESFEQWQPDVTLQGSVVQLTIRVDVGQTPYLILRLPASDSTARIFVAGHIDADTGDLAWAPVPGSYDLQTGLVTAAVGVDLFQRVELDTATKTKSETTHQGGEPLTYTGYVGVGIGGQQFNAQIVFIADEPTGQVEAKYDDPPIEVRGRVGASLSNITHPPLESLTVQSQFGPRPAPCAGCSTLHRGVDYVAPNGTTVLAAGDGVVTAVQWQNADNHGAGAGYYVKIDHGNGEETKYFHLQDPAQGLMGPTVPGCTDLGVCVGDSVTGGQPIATSDSTGNLTGPHLHFETWQNGVPVDPTLIYDEVVTGTIAIAIDYEVQAGTEQSFLLTRGILTPEDMMQYSSMVTLADIEGGEHKLQFVVVEPSGTLEILATVPLVVVNLNGRWIDHGTDDLEVTIAQAGSSVSAVLVESKVCDHRDGQGTTSETTEDFVGTLDGLTITGMLKVCAYGCQADDSTCRPNGIVDAPFTLFVDPGGEILDGFWLDEDGNERGLSLSRLEVPSE